jgi:hypothetical protein
LVLREGGGWTKRQILEKPAWQLLQGSRRINRLLRRWKPWIEQKRRLSCRRKIGFYDQDGWLDAFYARWDAYVRSLGAKGPAVEQIFLEPNQTARVGNVYSWRIAPRLQRAEAKPAGNCEYTAASGAVERVALT